MSANIKYLTNDEIVDLTKYKNPEKIFIDFSDGTCFGTIQLVYDNSLENFIDIKENDVIKCFEMIEVKR